MYLDLEGSWNISLFPMGQAILNSSLIRTATEKKQTPEEDIPQNPPVTHSCF